MSYSGWKRLQDYAVDLLRGMVEVPSPTGREQELAALIRDEMDESGFITRLDDVGNVHGIIKGGHPRVLLCGHMDTVPGQIPVKLKDGILYGRGSVDAKGPLAAIIVATSQLLREGYKGGLHIVGAVDEEGRGRGVKHILEEGVNTDYAIFGEPTNVNTITIGYRGSLLLNIRVETETGHSSAPWLFDNAIEKAMELWYQIKNRYVCEGNVESRFHSTSACLERIRGGGSGSVVPPNCDIQIGIRIPPSIKVDEMIEEVSRTIMDFKSQNTDIEINKDILDSTEAYIADSRSSLVRSLSQAIWIVRRERVKLIYKTGTGDMNNFGNRIDIPVVTYGPGDPHLDHTPKEHINIDDYLASIKVIKQTLLNLAKK